MTRIPLGYFIIVGLVFWGLLGTTVAGPLAILYTIAAALPVWWFSRGGGSTVAPAERRVSTATCAVLAVFTLTYLVCDALFGRQLLQFNMFLHGGAGADQLVEGINDNMSKGGGALDLLGTILGLLPLAIIDATRRTSRYGRYILWTIAVAFLFYEMGAGRGFLLTVVMAVVLGRTSDWRRVLVAAGLALAAFTLASSFRGDFANARNPLVSGVMVPVGNLALMLGTNCGNAPWYSFIAEFLKKFLPAFLIPKTIFSFNMEISLCIYPSIDNRVDSVSVFTWLGEIFYYKPSLLTAILAGCILGFLAWIVDRQLVRHNLYSARIFAGLSCIFLPRSRTQDMFSSLIAQMIFLAFFWPQLCNLTRTLHRFLALKNEPTHIKEELS